MSKGLRRTLIVGAALLMLVTLLLFRLDTESINAKLEQELFQFSESSLKMEKASLTFMHGIGLKLDQASMESASFAMQAGHINVSLHLLPLLLGKIEVEALDIHDALITIQPQSMQLTSTAISALPVERIHLIRSTVQTDDEHEILNDLHLELRDIGANHETKWELQAQRGDQSVSGHGRLNFHAGVIKNGFGKLKLEQIPLARIQPFLPPSLHKFIHHDKSTLSSSLTLDINDQNDWAVFGELKLLTKGNKTPIKIRGKLSHPTEGLLQWQDSFIHLSNSAVMAIDGECREQNCSTQLKAENIEFESWSSLIPEGITFHRQLSGETDLNANISWNDTSWQGEIGFNLEQGSYHFNEGIIELPELQLSTSNIAGDTSSWQATASLTAPGIDGSMDIESSQSTSGQKHMSISAREVDASLWQPLANLMFASLDIDPRLIATGTLNGELQLQQNSQKKSLQINLDAGAASVAYSTGFKKPEGAQATCHGEFLWQASTLSHLKLNDCQLGSSTIGLLQWATAEKQQDTLKLKNVAVNFDQLKEQSITLPESLSLYRGHIEGEGIFSRHEQSPIPWLKDASGQWRLQNFGTEHWDANGLIQADNGRFSSQRLLFDGLYGLAELKGELSFADKHGTIDVISAQIDWSQTPTLPGIWKDMIINGKVELATVDLIHNNWGGIKTDYLLKKGVLKLKDLNSSIAGGSLSARSLSFQPGEDNLIIHGKVKLKDIQLEKLKGLQHLLEGELKGILHANLELHGTIPETNASDWQQTNGDILIYSGQWHQQAKASSLAERLGLKDPGITSYAFKRLESRFRIHEMKTIIKPVSLLRLEQHYNGQLEIDLQGEITGQITQQDNQSPFSLTGEWPYLSWQPNQR